MNLPSMTSGMSSTGFCSEGRTWLQKQQPPPKEMAVDLATLPWAGEGAAGEQGGVGVEVRPQPSMEHNLESEAGREGGAVRI